MMESEQALQSVTDEDLKLLQVTDILGYIEEDVIDFLKTEQIRTLHDVMQLSDTDWADLAEARVDLGLQDGVVQQRLRNLLSPEMRANFPEGLRQRVHRRRRQLNRSSVGLGQGSRLTIAQRMEPPDEESLHDLKMRLRKEQQEQRRSWALNPTATATALKKLQEKQKQRQSDCTLSPISTSDQNWNRPVSPMPLLKEEGDLGGSSDSDREKGGSRISGQQQMLNKNAFMQSFKNKLVSDRMERADMYKSFREETKVDVLEEAENAANDEDENIDDGDDDDDDAVEAAEAVAANAGGGDIRLSANVPFDPHEDIDGLAGSLTVDLVKARNLIASDFLSGTSDPFVELQLIDSKITGQKRRSRIIEKTLNPVWHETFYFSVTTRRDASLVIKVFDKDLFLNDFIGGVKIPLVEIPNGRSSQIYRLEKVTHGDLFLDFDYTPHRPRVQTLLSTPRGAPRATAPLPPPPELAALASPLSNLMRVTDKLVEEIDSNIEAAVGDIKDALDDATGPNIIKEQIGPAIQGNYLLRENKVTDVCEGIFLTLNSKQINRGEEIVGIVVMKVLRKMKWKEIFVRVEGWECCAWVRGASLVDEKKRFLREQVAVTPTHSTEGFMQPKTYRYPFRYRLPHNTPMSYRKTIDRDDFKRGVSYRATVFIRGRSQEKWIARENFCVTGDWSLTGPAKPARVVKEVFPGMRLSAYMHAPSFKVGEVVKLSLRINNSSKAVTVFSTLEAQLVERGTQRKVTQPIDSKEYKHVISEAGYKNSVSIPTGTVVVKMFDLVAENTWPSVETPNRLLSVFHQVLLTGRIVGYGPFTMRLNAHIIPSEEFLL